MKRGAADSRGHALVLTLVHFGGQALAAVLLARHLGPAHYGALAAILAILTPLAGLGSAGGGRLIFLGDGAGREEPALLGTWLTSGLVSAAIAIAGAVAMTDVPLGAVLSLSLAEVVCWRTLQSLHEARVVDHGWATVKSALLPVSLRVGAAIGTALLDAGLVAYGVLLAVGVGAVVLLEVRSVFWPVGVLQRVRFPTVLSNIRVASPVALGLLASALYADLDKLLLARIGGLEASGVYTAGYRFLAIAGIPMRGILLGLMRHTIGPGQQRSTPAAGFRRAGLTVVLLGLLGSSILLLLAPVVPLILGPGFRESTEVLRWLSPLAFTQGVSGFLGDRLIGLGRAWFRLGSMGMALSLQVAMIFLWAPQLGWRGAALATLAGEALLLAILGLAVTRFSTGE